MVNVLPFTQFLIFELGTKCNLKSEHPKCPINHRTKNVTALSNKKILELATSAYKELGFTGLIGFHFYNEPMIYWERMLHLMDSIRAEIPESRFILWTNGTILIDEPRFDNFELVVVTNYLNKDRAVYEKYYRNKLLIQEPNFDDRLTYGGAKDKSKCQRQFIEFIIDSYGEVILCCQDWHTEVKIGNVNYEELSELSDRKMRISNPLMNVICQNCSGKIPLANFDDEIYNKTINYLRV